MKRSRKILFSILIIMVLSASFLLTRLSSSKAEIMLLGSAVPVSSFTGVLSSLSNICLVLMVVFFGKPGFITALVFQLTQLPVMILGLIMRNNISAIPGVFGNFFTILMFVIIYRRNRKIEQYQTVEFRHLKERQKFSQRLFEQTATALVNSIDAKDRYSHGHSLRVAEYSEKIARLSGKDEEECYRIYYAALLHDVGKIGIPISIINKKGRLTPEEYEVIKEHPVKGNQILTSINEYPYLSIGAHYHHERYDGKGYPDGLKGDDIPEIARIISVADAYDAMSSNRSYREAIPQQLIREEIIKGAGTQFDPNFAACMKMIIDEDTGYRLRERNTVTEFAGRYELDCSEFGSEISDGIPIINKITKIRLSAVTEEGDDSSSNGPAFIMFDSLDGRFHEDEKTVTDLLYYEYCRIWLDGRIEGDGVRKIETSVTGDDAGTDNGNVYDIEAVKYRDHVLVCITHGGRYTETTIALPDSSRFVYIALTGENCVISDVTINKEDEEITADFIPRIAEEISYIDVPEGDMPNVQMDGYRTDATAGIPVGKKMQISFHSVSLPTARLIWHCPFLVLFSSKDGKVGGEGYKEYGLIRLDGEKWESEGCARNNLLVDKAADFKGWDAWKEYNKAGIDVVADIERNENDIRVSTDNFGISIVNTTTILDDEKDMYVAITGDQCAVTGIKIR